MEMNNRNSKAAVVRALRRFVGRHAMPVEIVADMTGINPKTVYAHMHPDGSCPDFDQVRAYGRALGAQFMNALLAVDGFSVVHVEPQQHCMYGFMTETQRVALTWSEAIQDGVIDHTERPVVVPLVRNYASLALGYMADLERRAA